MAYCLCADGVCLNDLIALGARVTFCFVLLFFLCEHRASCIINATEGLITNVEIVSKYFTRSYS